MLRVIWTSEAVQDREAIWDYISKENPTAAAQMDALVSDAASRLADFSQIGKLGEITGTRELIIHKNYRLVYEIVEETVWILTLVHVARQWPPVH